MFNGALVTVLVFNGAQVTVFNGAQVKVYNGAQVTVRLQYLMQLIVQPYTVYNGAQACTVMKKNSNG